MRSRGPKKFEHYPRSLPFDRLDVMHAAAAVPRVPFPGTVRRGAAAAATGRCGAVLSVLTWHEDGVPSSRYSTHEMNICA
jgi:hypothetical protein